MLTKRKKTTRIIFSKGLFAVLTLFLLFFSYSLIKEIKHKQAIQTEINDLEKDLVLIEADNNQLQSLIEYLQTDEYAELEAKRKLGMKREGEKVILVTQTDDLGNSPVPVETGSIRNWSLWWSHFFKKN